MKVYLRGGQNSHALLTVSKYIGVKETGFGAKHPRTVFKTMPFTLAVIVTEALFGTKVVLEER